MDFFEYLDHSKELIKSEISLFIKKKQEEELPKVFKEQRLLESLESFVSRGKFVRGTLFLLMVEALGGNITAKHIRIACAIELMHSSLLVQDDVIDKDKMRRGARTVFSQYEEEGKNIGAFDPYHYGVSTAFIVADVAFFFAIELLSDYNSPSLSSLLKYYAHEVYLVAVAESVDSIFGQTDREPTKEEIYAVYKYKTARYTFSLPFEMAAIVSGSNSNTRKSLSNLGEMAGIIFQLKDDEIGLFGKEETIGKPVGSDIRENKKTMIRYHLYNASNGTDRKTLDSCFGNPSAEKSEIEKIKFLYQKYEIDKIINSEIESIMDKVWENYRALNIRAEFKEILKGLLEFNLNRSY